MFPSYISSQTKFYNQIAEDYFSSIAATHTKSEYDAAINRICRKWMREFTNENVLTTWNLDRWNRMISRLSANTM